MPARSAGNAETTPGAYTLALVRSRSARTGRMRGFFFRSLGEIRTWWRSGDVAVGDGFAQAFQEPFELGLAVLKPSHAPIQALHVLAHVVP